MNENSSCFACRDAATDGGIIVVQEQLTEQAQSAQGWASVSQNISPRR